MDVVIRTIEYFDNSDICIVKEYYNFEYPFSLQYRYVAMADTTNYNHYIKQGFCERYDYKSKAISEMYIYVNDSLDGNQTNYYRTGAISSVRSYKRGVLNGLSSLFYQNGNIREMGGVHNGKKNLHWVYYYENGNMKMQGNYLPIERIDSIKNVNYNNDPANADGDVSDSPEYFIKETPLKTGEWLIYKNIQGNPLEKIEFYDKGKLIKTEVID